MKLITKTLFILLLSVTPFIVQAQDDDEPSELLLFRGGYMDINFGMNLNSVGSSLGSGGMGGLISGRIDNGALNVNLNPAHLTSLKKGYIAFDTRLGLGTSFIGSVNDELISTINDEIGTQIDETFDDETAWTKFPETYIKPTELRRLDAGLSNELSSIAFAAPINDRFVVAGAYTYPVSMNFDFALTGLSTKLAQEQGTDEVAIRFDVLMNISLLTKMEFRMSTMSFGGAGKIIDTPSSELSLGATLTRYQVNNVRSLQADLSGMVVVGGADERYFNNASDPNLNYAEGESNQFGMNAYGEFEASGYGYKFGLNYTNRKGISASIMYNYVPEFDLSGENKAASANLPVFIVGSGEDVLKGDIEVTLDSLQANKPNLTTERDISSLVDDGRLKLPSSLVLGVDVPLRRHTLVLNYTNYMGDLAFVHGGHTMGKATAHGVGMGLDLQFRDRYESWGQLAVVPIRLLFLDFDGMILQALGKFTKYKDPHYRMGGNVMLGDGIVTFNNSDLEDVLALPLPQAFSLGRQYTIFDHVDVGLTVFAVPDLMFKYSLGLRF